MREDVAAVSVAAAALVAIGGEAGEWSGGAPVRGDDAALRLRADGVGCAGLLGSSADGALGS